MSINDLSETYSSILTSLVDQLAPSVTVKKHYRPITPWFNAVCRAEKRKSRCLERTYRRTRLVHRPVACGGPGGRAPLLKSWPPCSGRVVGPQGLAPVIFSNSLPPVEFSLEIPNPTPPVEFSLEIPNPTPPSNSLSNPESYPPVEFSLEIPNPTPPLEFSLEIPNPTPPLSNSLSKWILSRNPESSPPPRIFRM